MDMTDHVEGTHAIGYPDELDAIQGAACEVRFKDCRTLIGIYHKGIDAG